MVAVGCGGCAIATPEDAATTITATSTNHPLSPSLRLNFPTPPSVDAMVPQVAPALVAVDRAKLRKFAETMMLLSNHATAAASIVPHGKLPKTLQQFNTTLFYPFQVATFVACPPQSVSKCATNSHQESPAQNAKLPYSALDSMIAHVPSGHAGSGSQMRWQERFLSSFRPDRKPRLRSRRVESSRAIGPGSAGRRSRKRWRIGRLSVTCIEASIAYEMNACV